MARILIAGCGYVGTALAEELAAEGHQVWGLRRTPTPPKNGVTYLAADLARPESLQILPKDLSHVAYTAAADGRSGDAYHQAYVQGPKNLLAALESQNHPIQRILFTSSTGVYGQNQGEWVDETSPTNPTTATGKILLEGEKVFLKSSHPATILRLAGIYGPGRTRLIDLVKTNQARRPSEPRYTNRIHRDDCAGALRHLMFLENPEEIYIGVDDEPADLGDVFDWIVRELGLPKVPLQEGEPATRRGGGKRCRGEGLRQSGYRLRVPTFRVGGTDRVHR